MVKQLSKKALSSTAKPVGYAWLIERFSLVLPSPTLLTAIEGGHRERFVDGWRLLPSQYSPPDTLAGHCNFALKREGVELSVLDALFRATAAESIAEIVRESPTGMQSRRLWFLYEWLREAMLDLPDAKKISEALAKSGM